MITTHPIKERLITSFEWKDNPERGDVSLGSDKMELVYFVHNLEIRQPKYESPYYSKISNKPLFDNFPKLPKYPGLNETSDKKQEEQAGRNEN